uniref:galactose-specific lectin nattectin n=1 Tax=Scatophagus argus TaxID=75038 RepID=UPI001ED84BC4|nr:galactose-specific lectin nattectin [Scatophagus argus]
MKLLAVPLALCSLLTLSHAGPLNYTSSRHVGHCEYKRQHSPTVIGGFVPQCDADGNFLPQQCWPSTGYCWCVDVITGEEIPNTKTPPGTPPVICDSHYHYCPYGWSRYGEHCFMFIDSEKTWIEAEGYCLFEGGNLASIHSQEENHFIQALTRGDTHDFPETWIGGHDAIHQCFWMWTDGSKFDYDNWEDECEKDTMEHCLKMNYGYKREWKSAFCNGTLPFVCAKKI